jgi:twitching motility protein PilT
MVGVKTILAKAIEKKASDVHINVGMPPILRKNTELLDMDFPAVTDKDAKEILITMIGPERFKTFEEKRDLDFSTAIDDGHRFRVNAHYQRDTIAISFRVIPNHIPSIDELHLPSIVKELADLPRGLVLVTGHTGSGKSTTLAATIGLINTKYRKRIITLEDPIEYALENKKSMIEQREIGSDCPNFASGLRHVLRQDPDIIMVGEMRDLETTSSTITAAETGHLVFSTLHTINAPQTVERIIDIYPANQQNQIRTMLANTLQAVISQTLLRLPAGWGCRIWILALPICISRVTWTGKRQLHGQPIRGGWRRCLPLWSGLKSSNRLKGLPFCPELQGPQIHKGGAKVISRLVN